MKTLAITIAAVALALTGCTATSDDQPKAVQQQAPPEHAPLDTIPDPDAPPEEPKPEEPNPPSVFDELGCDTVKTDVTDGEWACINGDATAYFSRNRMAHSDRLMLELGVDMTTVEVHDYNPNGDVFFVDHEGVLYLPGDGFTNAMLYLGGADDVYGAEVVDTDRLRITVD